MGPVIVIHASCEVHGVTMASSVMTDELVLKKATKSCMRNVVSRFQTFLMNFLKVFRIDLFRTVLCSVQETRTTATGPPPSFPLWLLDQLWILRVTKYVLCDPLYIIVTPSFVNRDHRNLILGPETKIIID